MLARAVNRSLGGVDGTEHEAGETGSWSTRRKVLITLGAVLVAALSFLAGSRDDLGWLMGGSDDESAAPDEGGDWNRADEVAVDDDGRVRASVEVAPATDGDGRCVRVLMAGEVAGARCSDGPLNPWDAPDFEVRRLDQYFGSLYQYAARTDDGWTVALTGAVHPEVVRVTAHFGDGTQYSFVTRNAGGWFVTVLPEDVADPAVQDGRLVNAPARLELFDAEGTRIASVDLASGSTAV